MNEPYILGNIYDGPRTVLRDPLLGAFNPRGTWMDRVDEGLLERLWERRGCPGVFVRWGWYGCPVVCISTVFGRMEVAYDEVLRDMERMVRA